MPQCVRPRNYIVLDAAIVLLSLFALGATAQDQIDPFDAISNSREVELEAYLDRGGNPNATDHDGSLVDYAVRAHKVDLVNLLLQHGADPNISNGVPLFTAAREGYLEIAKALITHGAKVDPVEGRPVPLWAAMGMQHIDVAQLLLSNGATMLKGRTSLMYAIKSGSAELTRAAIAANAPDAFKLNMNLSLVPAQSSEDEWGDEPLVAQAEKPDVLEVLLDAHFDPNAAHGFALIHASFSGNVEDVRLLLSHGADPNVGADIAGKPQLPIVIAAGEGHTEVVRALLLAHSDPNLADSDGHTALIESSTYDHEDVVRVLLDANADPDRADRAGNTALEHAIGAKQLGLVTLLVQHHANTNVKKGAPLLLAAQAGYLDIAKLLVANGASVNPLDGEVSPLLAAMRHLDVTQFLLSKGAAIPPGRTGLSWAIRSDSAELTRMVLAKNSDADVSTLNLSPRQPSGVAGKMGLDYRPLVAQARKADVLEVLLSAHFDPNAGHGLALADACSGGNIDVVDALLSHGADPNLGADDSGYPTLPLINAADNDHAEVVRVLLSAHANPNLSDSKGNTALLLSSQEGYGDIVHYLLNGKADPNHPNRDGNTPLILASRYAHVDVVRYLLAAGANVNARNKEGSTALLESSAEGSPRILSMLIAKGADRRATKGGRTATDLAIANKNHETLAVLRSTKPAQWEHGILPRDLEVDSRRRPGDVRRSLLDSTIFRDTYLLSVLANPGQPLALEAYQQAELKVRVQFIFQFVKQMIQNQTNNLEESLGVSLIPTKSTKVVLENNGTAEAYTLQTNDNPSGAIAIDLKLIKAAFESSVLNDSHLNYNAHSRAELSDKLLSERRDIENLAYQSHVMTTTEGMILLTSQDRRGQRSSQEIAFDANHLTGFLGTILPAAVQYYGILLFIVAHELGHVALGHGIREIPCFERELDADRFAALVLGQSLAAMSIRVNALYSLGTDVVGEYLALDRSDLKSYTGFSLFFDKTYELAKFGPSSQACVYPESSQRLQQSEASVDSIASANEYPMIAKLSGSNNREAFLAAGLIARQRMIAATLKKGNTSDFTLYATVVKQLRAQGYDILGTPIDRPDELFATTKDLKNILIHISNQPGSIGDRVIEKLMESVRPSGHDSNGIDEVWVVSNSPFTHHAKDLARKYRVRLIDSADLSTQAISVQAGDANVLLKQ